MTDKEWNDRKINFPQAVSTGYRVGSLNEPGRQEGAVTSGPRAPAKKDSCTRVKDPLWIIILPSLPFLSGTIRLLHFLSLPLPVHELPGP